MGTKKKQFTFKTVKPKGKWRWLDNPDYKIMFDRSHVGSIDQIYGSDKYNIRFRIVKKDIMEDGNQNCPWRWVTLSYIGDSLDDCKTYVTENIDKILNTFTLQID